MFGPGTESKYQSSLKGKAFQRKGVSIKKKTPLVFYHDPHHLYRHGFRNRTLTSRLDKKYIQGDDGHCPPPPLDENRRGWKEPFSWQPAQWSM